MTVRVRVGTRLIRLTADGNRYAGVYQVQSIRPDADRKRCTVHFGGFTGRARLNRDGTASLPLVRLACGHPMHDSDCECGHPETK